MVSFNIWFYPDHTDVHFYQILSIEIKTQDLALLLLLLLFIFFIFFLFIWIYFLYWITYIYIKY